MSYISNHIHNGHLISNLRREVWDIELDMLDLVVNICDKIGVKYYLDAGTLLGAVRHQGFIPWDDDIDLVMFRDEYDKFISYCRENLEYPYFLQVPDTDSSIYQHAKIRRSDTTAILEKDLEANWDFNQGIFIDIFPLDRVPEDKGKRERFLYELQLIRLELFFLKNRSWKFANIPLERERMNYLKNLYEKNRKRYNNTQENCWATLAFPEHNNIIKNIDFYKNQYPDVFLTFEGRDLRVPNIYHGVLEDIYGEDYLTPKKYSGLHGRILVNTHKTYKNNMEDFQILK